MSYELRDHTADVAVEARGETPGEAFAAVADGMAFAMCEEVPESGERYDISVTAESLEALLFDYLDDLIYERDVRDVLPVDNRGTVDQIGDAGEDERWRFSGSYRGVPLTDVTARDLKAVTYSEMEITEREDGWFAYVVFDV